MSVIWHDIECGSYAEDLPLWRSLAAEHGDPVLDVGAGTGRVSLVLAREGHRVTALDRDPALLDALAQRADRVDVTTVVADARDFDLPERFPLIIVPMQTIQLLGGPGGRRRFLAAARRHLLPGGALAIAIAELLETYEVVDGMPAPLPDLREEDGIVYSSQPIAVRADHDGFVLERRRETVSRAGQRTVEQDLIHLDLLTVEDLEREGSAAGLEPAQREHVRETADYSGSEVVILRG
ncbi:MAG TPA: class I SAM-dependent methyltransferase [Solirubrobacteraceae bacterium]|nr:class I SAM-dependent methyltransferase [Solirubrobacteraceae bacterium]